MGKKWLVLYAVPLLWYAVPLAVRALGPILPSGLVIVWFAAGIVYAFGVFLKYGFGFSLWHQEKYPEAGALSDGWGLRAARKRRGAMTFTPEGGDPELDRRRKDYQIAFALFPVTGLLAVVWFLVYTGF